MYTTTVRRPNVSSPHPSALRCCHCPPLLPLQPRYSLEGIVAVLKVLFLDLSQAILLIVFSSFLLWFRVALHLSKAILLIVFSLFLLWFRVALHGT
jgi:hypothetical protein